MKYLKISLATLGILLFIACASAPKEPEMGMYLNGWPTFSVSYPAQWLEKTPTAPVVFRADAPEDFPSLKILVIANLPEPLKYSTRVYVPFLAKRGKDIKVISDGETRLRDGTPAWETVIEWVPKTGIKQKVLFLTTKKEEVWITATISDTKDKIGEDLKTIPYSLKIKPGKEEPVELPDDIQAFMDKNSRDIVSRDLEKVMLNYSDRFLHNGRRKADIEAFFKRVILGVTSFQINITSFESRESNAYVAGYALVNGTMKFPIPGMMFIKENGQWKYFGNQK